MDAQMLQLPCELKLNIFQRLPAKDILRSRQVCTNFRDFIKSNEKTLANPIKAHELARLNAFVKHHNYKSIDLAEGLSRWIKHRGIWLQGPCCPSLQRDTLSLPSLHGGKYTFFSFMSFLHVFMRMEFPPPSSFLSLIRGLWRFCQLHAAKHCDIPQAPDPSVISQYILNNAPDHTKDWMRSICQKIMDDPEFLRCVVHGSKVTPLELVPKVTLTIFQMDPLSIIGGICAESELRQLLDVPVLPGDFRFTYYVKDQRTAKLIEDVIRRGNRSFKPLVEAAVLEELGIY